MMTANHTRARGPLSETQDPRTVETVRDEIDRIDDAMLDLVEARVALTHEMATLKHDDGTMLKLRPRREAAVLARLAFRVRRADPAMVAQIWRTLMAYGLQDQAPMEVVLYADDDANRLALQDRVRGRFGPAPALRWAASPAEALDAARGTEAVAVVAGRSTPALDADDGAAKGLRVFETFEHAGFTAYAVGRVAAADLAPSEPSR